jgi:hypothetical protein
VEDAQLPRGHRCTPLSRKESFMGRRSRLVRTSCLIPIAFLILACDPDAAPLPTGAKAPLRTSASGMSFSDSVAFLQSNQNGESGLSSLATVTTISLEAGDSIYVTVESTDCSGNPETVTVYGAISGVVVSGSCPNLPGTQIKLGPAAAVGTISFKATHQSFGQGPSGSVSGFYPNMTVGMNDGYGDTDYNDVIISVQVVFHCPPTADSVLNNTAVLDALKDAMIRSEPFATPGSGLKKEYAGLIWRAPDGHLWTQLVYDPNATECNFPMQTLSNAAGITPPDSSEVVSFFHTHPSVDNEPTYGCVNWAQTPNDGKKVAHALPDDPQSGGGSPGDWAGLSSYSAYVITKSNHVYRLDPQWANNRSQNPNKWNLQGLHQCPVLMP